MAGGTLVVIFVVFVVFIILDLVRRLISIAIVQVSRPLAQFLFESLYSCRRVIDVTTLEPHDSLKFQPFQSRLLPLMFVLIKGSFLLVSLKTEI